MENTRLRSTPVAQDCYSFPKISWSAIFSGAFVGLGLGFLLHLFGIAIGLSAYHSTSAGAKTLAIGGFLALLINSIVSMATAGYVSGYLGRRHYSHCHGGVIYGFLTWSLALLLAAIFAMPLTKYLSTYNKTLAPSVVVSDTMPQNIEVTTQKSTDGQENTNQPLVKVAPETLTGSAWVIFLLFFIGALSSCIGACYGISCKRDDFDEVRSEPRRTDVEL